MPDSNVPRVILSCIFLPDLLVWPFLCTPNFCFLILLSVLFWPAAIGPCFVSWLLILDYPIALLLRMDWSLVLTHCLWPHLWSLTICLSLSSFYLLFMWVYYFSYLPVIIYHQYLLFPDPCQFLHSCSPVMSVCSCEIWARAISGFLVFSKTSFTSCCFLEFPAAVLICIVITSL